MIIWLCGGGSAGHVNPAIAMAEVIRRDFPDARFFYFGRKGGRENARVPKDFALTELPLSGFSGKNPVKALRAVALALRAEQYLKKRIHKERPDLVIGTGGYVSVPVLRAAVKAGIPTAVHEANAVPGLAVRWLSRKVTLVLLGFAGAADYLPKKSNVRVVGMPIRECFYHTEKSAARKKLGIPGGARVVVSLGGSIGAAAINEAVIGFMRASEQEDPSLVHVHATGERYYDELAGRFPALSDPKAKKRIVPYLDPISDYLAAADVVIARAGANTIAEIAAVGRPVILVPSPNVPADHQKKNAKSLADAGAALLVEEADLCAETLGKKVSEILRSDAIARQMRSEIAAFSPKNGSAPLRDALRSLLNY